MAKKSKDKTLSTHNQKAEMPEMGNAPPAKQPILTTLDVDVSAKEYCNRFAIDEDWKNLQKAIVERRSKIPQYSYWKCQNPHCGHRSRDNGEAPVRWKDRPRLCIKCNFMGLKGNLGWLVEMTKKEEAQFIADEKAHDEARRERDLKAALYRRNEDRQKRGLEPLTRKEFDEVQKAEYQRMIRESHGGPK